MERRRGGDSIEGKNLGVVVGCAGWSSFRPKLFFGENWKETFSSVLQAYSRIFSFVEVNSTFYKLPKVETARKWREQVGESFLFSVKAHRSVTHEKRFEDVDEEVENLIEVSRAMRAFFILFQTPKSYKFSKQNLKQVIDFVESLPNEFIYGFELRGWRNEEVQELVKTVEVVHVVDPFERKPVRGHPYYFRLHGSPPGEKMYKYKYTDEDLAWLRSYVEELEGDVYVVFNNIWMCDDALRFRGLLEASQAPESPP